MAEHQETVAITEAVSLSKYDAIIVDFKGALQVSIHRNTKKPDDGDFMSIIIKYSKILDDSMKDIKRRQTGDTDTDNYEDEILNEPEQNLKDSPDSKASIQRELDALRDTIREFMELYKHYNTEFMTRLDGFVDKIGKRLEYKIPADSSVDSKHKLNKDATAYASSTSAYASAAKRGAELPSPSSSDVAKPIHESKLKRNTAVVRWGNKPKTNDGSVEYQYYNELVNISLPIIDINGLDNYPLYFVGAVKIKTTFVPAIIHDDLYVDTNNQEYITRTYITLQYMFRNIRSGSYGRCVKSCAYDKPHTHDSCGNHACGFIHTGDVINIESYFFDGNIRDIMTNDHESGLYDNRFRSLSFLNIYMNARYDHALMNHDDGNHASASVEIH